MFINSLKRSCWSDTIWLQLRNVNDWYTMRRLFTYKLTQTIWKQQILWMKVKQNHAENTPTSKPKHSQIHINLYLYLEILRNNSSLFFCVFVFSRSIWISHAIIPAGAAETDLLHKVLLSTIASLGFFFFRFFFFFLFFFCNRKMKRRWRTKNSHGSREEWRKGQIR